MGGDVHIILNKLQELPCKGEHERIKSNTRNIAWLRNFTIGGVLLIIAGAAVKIWFL